MHRFTRIFCLLAGLAFFAPTVSAQDVTSGVVVLSQNKCALDRVQTVIEESGENLDPILDRMVDQGRLYGYGYLTHLWGDEWNFVVYYVAPSAADFTTVMGDVFGAVNDEHPDFYALFAEHCTEHKDSIYNIAKMVTAQ